MKKHPVQKAPTDAEAMELVDANPSRVSITIQNAGAVRVYFGPDDTVSDESGVFLEPGGSLTEADQDAWFCRAASGTGDVRGYEVF